MDTAQRGVSRRAFLGGGVAAGVAIAGRFDPLAWARGTQREPWIEASIPELQALMARGRLTSRELTIGYLHRIRELNPLLGAVIETNPDAVSHRGATRPRAPPRPRPRAAARHPDPAQGQHRHARPHGDDRRLAGPGRQPRARRRADRRAASRGGAVILGKANLSEWANFRGFAPFNGWSARGGFTRDPVSPELRSVRLELRVGVAPAANLCAAAVGTETDGSVVCPLGNNLGVGLKPTRLLAQDGIIPTRAQPGHGRADRPDRDGRRDPARAMHRRRRVRPRLPRLREPAAARRVAWRADRRRPPLLSPRTTAASPIWSPSPSRASQAMRRLGATVVDTDTGDPSPTLDAEFTVLLFEFKVADRAVPRHAGPHLDAHARRSHRVQRVALRGRDEVLRPGDLRAARGHERRPTDPEYVDARACA
jgi:amidase